MTQPFLNFFYSHYMFAGNFDSSSWVTSNVFGFVETSTENTKIINAIYSDPRYGMNTEQLLSVWIAACNGDAETQEVLSLVWFEGKYQLPTGWLANITATNSTGKIYNLIQDANAALISAKIFDKTSDITVLNMAARQWAMGDLLNSKDLVMNPNSAEMVSSVRNIGMNFMTMPEITQSGCETTFTPQDFLNLFNQDLETGAAMTLLNPTNLWTFQHQYTNNEWTTVSGSFGLDQAQAQCIFNYANQQGSYAPYQAYGNMLTEGAMSSLNNLTATLPLNLATRVMAYRLSHGQMDGMLGGPSGNDWCMAMVG